MIEELLPVLVTADAAYDNLFEDPGTVVNLDAIPEHHKEPKDYFEKNYSQYPVSLELFLSVHLKFLCFIRRETVSYAMRYW